MPIIAQKEDETVGTITLYGQENPLAKAIFENMNCNINSSNIDILSLNNNYGRDLGHALTIEIEIENTKTHASYFILKVCNIDMINNLKRITP